MTMVAWNSTGRRVIRIERDCCFTLMSVKADDPKLGPAVGVKLQCKEPYCRAADFALSNAPRRCPR